MSRTTRAKVADDVTDTYGRASILTFDTANPIAVTLDLSIADVRINASERMDTVVEVCPKNPTSKADLLAAQQTRVDFGSSRLVISSPKSWTRYMRWGGRESIEVLIALPTGSNIKGSTGVGALRTTGRLGECRYKTGYGEMDIEEAGPIWVRTGMGDTTIDRATAAADVSTGSGFLRVSSIAGDGVVKNSNGDISIGEVGGDLQVNAASGTISVDHARSSVTARTANGAIRLGNVGRGTVSAHTALGNIDIAITEGVAAWLDLTTRFGSMHNALGAAEPPSSEEATVRLHARTSCGDITVRRAQALPAGSTEDAK